MKNKELLALDTSKVDKLLGFFSFNQMAYTLDMEKEGVVGIEPTLPEMTEIAIKILSRDRDIFFLMAGWRSDRLGSTCS